MEPEKQWLDRMIAVAAGLGANLFRNDNGMARRYHDPNQVFRYGLGKGTHDLVGWVPVVITQKMVGMTVAQFCSVEGKRGSDRLTKEQTKFHNAVNAAGGFSFVASDEHVVDNALRMHQVLSVPERASDGSDPAAPAASGHT